VLRGLFGTKPSILPPPPKNQIEVACPACGAAQYEPRLVVSTFCKACGVHLTIEKKKVTASSVTRSGAVGINDLWENPTPKPAATAPAPTAPATAPAPAQPESLLTLIKAEPAHSPDPTPPAPLPPEPELIPAEEAAQAGFGAFLQAASAKLPTPPETPTPKAEHPHLPLIKPRPEPAIPPAPPPPSVPATPPNSTLEKMKSQSVYRQQYFKDIECFECGHKIIVSRSSKFTDCPQCKALICLEDLDINLRHTEPIRTRGDVTVRKLGQIITSKVQCKDLRCLGLIDAEVDCQGEATFRTEGTIKGPVQCAKLTIEKGADVTFTDPVKAGDMFINSRVTATLSATGKITIGLYGSVNGDVTARAVTIDPGGELNGAMNILRKPTPTAPPAPE
jgi:cytoskeletal protein CcmA (bactofilin family)